MTVFDILIAVILILALWRGFRQGFFVQLAGLAGLFVGVWLAVKFGHTVGTFLGVSEKYASVAGFLIVLLAVILAIAGIGRVFNKIFSFAGLSLLDKLAGMLLSLAKAGLILGVLIWGFDSINRSRVWVSEDKLDRSVFYRPLADISVLVFPYIRSADRFLAPLYRDGEGSQTQTEVTPDA